MNIISVVTKTQNTHTHTHTHTKHFVGEMQNFSNFQIRCRTLHYDRRAIFRIRLTLRIPGEVISRKHTENTNISSTNAM
jgi:hypothetical protein